MKGLLRILLVFSLVWIIARSAVFLLPGDPAEFLVHESLVQLDTPELREKMDLDRPALERIFSLPRNRSLIRNEKASQLLIRAWSRTLVLAALALLIALPATFIFLFLRFQGGLRGRFSEASTLILASVPLLIAGPILLRYVPLSNPLLPALTLSLYLVPFWSRTLSRKLDARLPMSSVEGSRALGFPELNIFTRDLIAPALGGFLAFFGSQLGYLLNGSILVETAFQWNGVGSLLGEAVLSRDFPVIEMTLITSALITLITQQVGYALQTWWDPRIT